MGAGLPVRCFHELSSDPFEKMAADHQHGGAIYCDGCVYKLGLVVFREKRSLDTFDKDMNTLNMNFLNSVADI